MDRIPGELVAIAPAPDTHGTWRLAAVVDTEKGLIAGVLVAPAGGGTGQLGFHPVPELAHAARAVGEAAETGVADPIAEIAGALTTAAVPTRTE